MHSKQETIDFIRAFFIQNSLKKKLIIDLN